VTALRGCRIIFWANAGLLVLLALSVFGLHESQAWIRGLVVEFRNSLMMRSSSDVRLFASGPDALASRDFPTDPTATVAAWRARLPGQLSAAGASNFRDEVDLAKAVVLSFSRSGNNRPIYRRPLLDKIAEAQRGNGFCSDYVEIFLALSEVNGLTAREVQNDVHGFADFFSASRSKWIFIDPQYAILATDEAGAYLSSLEIRQRRMAGRPVQFVFFGVTDRAIKSEADPRFQALYGDSSRFKRYVLTYGNNVLTEASRSELLAFLPWEARQLLLYVSGTKPHLLFLVDSFGGQYTRTARWYGMVFYAICGYFMVALGCYPMMLTWTRLKAMNPALLRQRAAEPNRSSVA
jgi:hypothetical protein